MAAIDDKLAELLQKVTDEDTEIDSAITFINGVPALVQAAVATATAQGATPAQLQAFTDLGALMDKKKADIAAALAANTPSA